jgi:DNA-binding transcriptional MerR regulator
METLLRIGDVAALLGISTKTIRYYHGVGLLPEPARAANGYRLYTAQDLVHLQRVRRLQALGLPLKSVRAIINAPDGVHQIHAVLAALLGEVDAEIATLQARRTRIVAALATNGEAVAGASPTFAAIEAQLAPYLRNEHAALLHQERQMWALVDAAQPPDDVRALGEALAAQLAAHPAEVQALLHWGERLAALSDIDPDDPALQQLAYEFVCSPAFHFLNTIVSADTPAPSTSAANALWSALATDMLTPAQRRFLALVQQLATDQPSEEHDDAITHI